jgi:hypothetical protein
VDLPKNWELGGCEALPLCEPVFLGEGICLCCATFGCLDCRLSVGVIFVVASFSSNSGVRRLCM